jgi:hypothetical protein
MKLRCPSGRAADEHTMWMWVIIKPSINALLANRCATLDSHMNDETSIFQCLHPNPKS